MTNESEPATHQPLSATLTLIMAVATGIVVANLYYLQPLLHQMTSDFRVSPARASMLIMFVQVGYAVGLAFVVPLGDLFARRVLIVAIFLLSAVMMATGAMLTSFSALCALTVAIGVTSVAGQVIVPFAADLAEARQRGRVIARVMSGLLFGILLSRTVSGVLAQAIGWRGVYWSAAGLLTASAVVLVVTLPDEPARPRLRYRDLVVGSFSLLVTEVPLRRRAWFGALVFAAFSVLWTTLSFLLAGAPFHYSNAVIGLFGLFGVAGVAAANLAGHNADRERTSQSTIGAAFALTISFAMLWFGRHSLWILATGVMLLDAGMNTMQISNQSIIYSLLPDARSRVNSAYMVCCFAGASLGSFGAGQLYASYAWAGVCWLGAALGAVLVVLAFAWRSPVVA